MKRLKFFPIILIIFICRTVHAQDQGGLNPTKFNVIPPAPNVAGISKYGNVPVNLFNGLPNVQVPLGNFSVGDEFSSEITLSYHAGGTRVDEVASFAGLGWSLRAGGVITRTVRGRPDENGYVGLNHQAQIPPNHPQNPDANNFEQFVRSAVGTNDTQPDEFSYNIGNYSGKFVVDANKNIYLIPYKDIKITWVQTIDGMYFTLVTEDGTKYIFNNQESTQNNQCSGDPDIYVSAWYLSQIILPKSKRTINFEYVADPGIAIPNTSMTESWGRNYGYTNRLAGCPTPTIPILSTCNTTRVQQQQKIKKITYPGGTVTFNYSFKRTDLSAFTTDIIYALSEIVYSNGNVTTEKYLLNYITPDRLRLSSVSTVDPSNNVINSYNFSYNSTKLPAVNSYAKDHWGYYNGASNTTLLPAMPGYSGADREANIQYTQAGILQTITYPTGGTTTFEYEGNSYSHYGTSAVVADPVYGSASVYKSIHTGVSGSTTYPSYIKDSLTINLNVDQYLDFELSLTSCCGNFSHCYITNVTTGDTVTPANGHSYIYLDSGQYRIIMEASHEEPTVSDEKVTVNAKYQTLTGTTGIAAGGGLRLKKMTTYDGISHDRDIIKTYTYQFPGDTVSSSGYLTNRPNYKYSFTSMRPVTYGVGERFAFPCDVWIRTSAAGNEIESAEGSVVYKTVLETDNQNGSTRYVYEFMNNSSGVGSYPFGPSTNVYPEKGSLKEQYIFSNTGQLLSKTINTYTTFAKGSIEGWKAAYSKKDDLYPTYAEEGFVNNYYQYISNGTLLSSSVKTEYAGTDSLITETDYVYDNMNHILPTRIHNTNSQGNDIWTFRKYPTDFAVPTGTLTSGAQALKQMQDSNMHNVPLEQYEQQIKQGVTTTLGAQYVRYKVLPATSATMVVMDTAFRLKTAAPLTSFTPAAVSNGTVKADANYEATISFKTYDSTGNIREQQAIYGVKEAYIWGYNNLYPVARIVGTSYDTAVSYVNMNVIRNPSSDEALRTELNKIRTGLAAANVLVSTYTVNPEVGVTSETDPSGKTIYYEYDAIGRLKVIKDLNGKILKQFSYQYVQPINQ
ncbi:hypothetical protein [Chitinophaga sp.]|uniref:hypothetical protein n=1 Tax=Chitinophaga sp. TaxID=1869181 RepID=UPI0031D0D496